MNALGETLFSDIGHLSCDRQIANRLIADDEDAASDRGNRTRSRVEPIGRMQHDRRKALIMKE